MKTETEAGDRGLSLSVASAFLELIMFSTALTAVSIGLVIVITVIVFSKSLFGLVVIGERGAAHRPERRSGLSGRDAFTRLAFWLLPVEIHC